jgi:hypothetical protein
MVGDLSKTPEFRDKTELQDTGQDGLQRFRKPLLYSRAVTASVHQMLAACLFNPGTPAAHDLLGRPRRFERPNFAAGAFTHTPIE